jgi:hypothetical protein
MGMKEGDFDKGISLILTSVKRGLLSTSMVYRLPAGLCNFDAADLNHYKGLPWIQSDTSCIMSGCPET